MKTLTNPTIDESKTRGVFRGHASVPLSSAFRQSALGFELELLSFVRVAATSTDSDFLVKIYMTKVCMLHFIISSLVHSSYCDESEGVALILMRLGIASFLADHFDISSNRESESEIRTRRVVLTKKTANTHIHARISGRQDASPAVFSALIETALSSDSRMAQIG